MIKIYENMPFRYDGDKMPLSRYRKYFNTKSFGEDTGIKYYDGEPVKIGDIVLDKVKDYNYFDVCAVDKRGNSNSILFVENGNDNGNSTSYFTYTLRDKLPDRFMYHGHQHNDIWKNL